MKLNEITGKPRARNKFDLIDSIENGIFTRDGSHLKVRGYLNIALKSLKSLEGCPLEIDDDFICDNNSLTSLVGSPQNVGGNFSCEDNKIKSLVGGPRKVGGHFSCFNNKLTSLEGCPEEIGGDFFGDRSLTSLEGIHTQLKKMNGIFYVRQSPIKSHVLGLLKIPGCRKLILSNLEVQAILEKYLPLGDIFDCQEELIEAGFEEYAQL